MRALGRPRAVLALAAAFLVAASAPGRKSRHGKQPEFPAAVDRTPAHAAAELDAPSCYRELERLGVRFSKEASAPGVAMPVRLGGPVAGVTYRTDYPDAQRATVPFEVFDCRLV